MLKSSPLFTFKHYHAVIQVLRANSPWRGQNVQDNHIQYENSIIRDGQWQKTVNAFADMFAADNPKFKRDLFVTMCHQNEETK